MFQTSQPNTIIIVELKNNKNTCASQVTIFMPANDVSLLKLHSKYVESLGLKMEYMPNGVHVTQVPLCLQDKLKSEVLHF